MDIVLQIATSKYIVPFYVGVVYYLLNRYGFLKEESNVDIEPIHIVIVAGMTYVAFEVMHYFAYSKVRNEISLRPMD